MLVELPCRGLGGVGDLVSVGEGLPGETLAAEHAPPCLLDIQPAGLLRDEDLLDTRVVGQPLAGACADVAGKIVADHRDRAGRVGLLQQVEELLPVLAVA